MKEILESVSKHKIGVTEAYRKLYKPKKQRKRRFVRMRIYIKEERTLSWFINLIFLLPLPLSVLGFIMKKLLREADGTTVSSADIRLLKKAIIRDHYYIEVKNEEADIIIQNI